MRKLYLFCVFLIGSVLSASIQRCAEASEECMESFRDIRPNILNLNLSTPTAKEHYQKSCKLFQKCTPSLKCNAIPQLISLVDNVYTICETSLYQYKPMSLEDCDKRMFARNSKCIQEYNPYPDKVESPVENARIQKKFCDEFFGKDGCLEQEMSEACGVGVFNGVKPNILSQNLTADGGLDKLLTACEQFKNCTPSLKCEAIPELVQTINDVNSFCEASLFRHSSTFESCDDKLNERNSTCINEWDPFPAEVEDPIVNRQLQKKFCDEFFGKDNCLEKEMSEACGVDVWNGFKKNQLALNKIAGYCIFD
ncbi:hypothetical protein CAEBREN_20832 [Caenorhabditis brenneri]|uniref:T20D4.11-like domain-containing protein n=1 Tax=Caenorhabditis brenneri TaxID=135651 RepID=G0MA12_CAEBE|nr:hypothetical protein CAEBREN_20832 [Caenorhabditis brenneri]